MSVLANTLNAYAGRLKAQRRAQERDAIRAARAKSQAQREAEQAQRQAIRAQKNAPKPVNKKAIVAFYLDGVVREMKRVYGYEMATGERARVSQDLMKITELFWYDGSLACSAYKKFDLTGYSTTAFEVIISALTTMKVVSPEGAHTALTKNQRCLVIHRTSGVNGQGIASVALTTANTDIEEITTLIHQMVREKEAA
jgi:multidrug efflux pump subunit AcrA (membrane-fusion protein)